MHTADTQKQLAAGVCVRCAWLRLSDTGRWVYILVTLCRFDHNQGGTALLGPFIPCERRLALDGFLEIQGRDFTTGF